MNKKSILNYQERILSLITILIEKDSLSIPLIDINEQCSMDSNKDNVVIPFKKIK